MKTKQQIANIRTFLKRWKTIPFQNVQLGSWQRSKFGEAVQTPHCGTIACAGGWCALMPEFRAQGVISDQYGIPRLVDERVSAYELAEKLFGDYDLFRSRGGADLHEIGSSAMSDHEIVARRFNRALRRG